MLIIFNQFYNLNSALYGICHLWFLLMLFGLFILAPIVWYFMERIKNDRIATVAVNASFLLYPIFCDVNLLQITKVFYFLRVVINVLTDVKRQKRINKLQY